MTAFERGSPEPPRFLPGAPEGFGWIAHPEESGQRTSHAIRTPDGVWLIDPLDAIGVEDRIAEVGEVAGVVVTSNYHARDADGFARRHGVTVTLPPWLDRAAGRIDARVRRDDRLGESGFRFRRVAPVPGWVEAALVGTKTLYVSEQLARRTAVGPETVGLVPPFRLRPPRVALLDTNPDHLLTGHGPGVHENATAALRTALDRPWRRLPRALIDHGPDVVRSVFSAARD